MERVAFLLPGTSEGKKTIDIFMCGKAAMSEEEKEALVRQVGLLNDGYESCGGFEEFEPGWFTHDTLIDSSFHEKLHNN
jgi:hypothetical protein